MSRSPLLNSLAALAYITIIAWVMTYGSKVMPHPNNSFLAPIAVISLFTLSAAVMGYVFCYQPAQLYFDGKKKQAVRLFLETVGVFAVLTICLLVVTFSGIFA